MLEGLSGWIDPEVLDRIVVHTGDRVDRWLGRFGLFGITFGYHLFILGSANTDIVRGRIVHEAVHAGQWRKWNILFYLGYIAIWPLYALMQSIKQMPFEKPAYRRQKEYLDDIR